MSELTELFEEILSLLKATRKVEDATEGIAEDSDSKKDLSWVENLKVCKDSIDNVIFRLQKISWSVDTEINKDKINKMFADSSRTFN